MGLFTRKSKATQPKPEPTAAPRRAVAPDPSWPNGSISVVGESHYSDAFLAIANGRDAWMTEADLVPEPENPYDSGAVAVRISGKKVGHLTRDDACRLRPVIDGEIRRGGRCATPALVRVRHDDPSKSSVVVRPDEAETGRVAITAALIGAGIKPRGDEGVGFTMRHEDDGWTVFFSGANAAARSRQIPRMVAALWDAGFKATVREDDSKHAHAMGGYLMVRVTGRLTDRLAQIELGPIVAGIQEMPTPVELDPDEVRYWDWDDLEEAVDEAVSSLGESLIAALDRDAPGLTTVLDKIGLMPVLLSNLEERAEKAVRDQVAGTPGAPTEPED